MSVCKEFGKDKVIFATKEDHSTPSTVVLPPSDPPTGLITPDGEINWNCPCLGGMATGPCGVEFRDAFSCFHYSEAEPKGSDCYEAFKTMQECFAQYPTVYNKTSGDDDDEIDLELSALSGDSDNQTTADTANLVVDEKTSSAISSSSVATTTATKTPPSPPAAASNTSSTSSATVDKAK